MKKYNIAIVGATGLVGGAFLQVMEEYGIPVNNLRLFASSKSVGKEVIYGGKPYYLEALKDGCFVGTDFALFSAGGSVSLKYAIQATNEGAIVIDNSSAWRMNKNVPLVVPEINMDDAYGQSLIANPNCSTIQAVLPLKILDEKFGIDVINYTTYQAVSGSGQSGISDLKRTLKGENPEFYPYNIAQTCIPHIDVFLEDGYTKEEHKMMNETRKILHNNDILISATCVRVPIENSHAISMQVILKKEATLEEVRNCFSAQEGLIVVDDVKNNIYPVSTLSNQTDNVYVGRLRKDNTNQFGLLFYVVADNLRKGAASNAVQIMKKLMEKDVTKHA
ncbi:MAG: aspartate-semialdehyde dehydrogenase [Firmicutes bacterium]|nr:aspartate-semialdehyde dehydrogenase [Bacillota bacterium]